MIIDVSKGKLVTLYRDERRDAHMDAGDSVLVEALFQDEYDV